MTNSDGTNDGLSETEVPEAGIEPGGNDTPLSVHDTFFYKIMSDPERAGAELRCVLPEEIIEVMDWKTLRVEPHRFSDGNLGNHFADLLLSIRVRKRKTYFHVLFEHSSGPKVHELLQTLRYQVRLWEKEKSSRRDEHQDPRRLTPILTVIFHHSETGWKGKLRFADYLDLDVDLRPMFAPYLVDFGVFVDDISRLDAEVLLARLAPPEVRVMLFALRFGRTGEQLFQELPKIARELLEIRRLPTGPLVLQAFFVYLSRVTKKPKAELRMALQNSFEPLLDPELAAIFDGDLEKARTLGEARERAELRQEGLREGLRKGERKGLREGKRQGLVKGKMATLRRLLELRFGPLPRAVVVQLEQSSLKDLEDMELRILTAETLERVLGLPGTPNQ